MLVLLWLLLVSNVVAQTVSAGNSHTLFLDTHDSSLYSAGLDWNGRLGMKGEIKGALDVPTKVDLSNIVSVAAGFDFSLFLTRDGVVLASGSNNSGKLGITLGPYQQPACITKDGEVCVSPPTQIEALPDIVSLAAGVQHSLFVAKDGSVYGAGSNLNGQLGQHIQVLCNCEPPCVFAKPYPCLSTPEIIPGVDNVIAAAAGTDHSLFLTRDGIVYAVGGNSHGQLGIGSTETVHEPTKVPNVKDVIAIAAGTYHSLFLTKDEFVFSAGWNKYGQLGIGNRDLEDVVLPIMVKDSGDVSAIAAGETFSLFLASYGTCFISGKLSGKYCLDKDADDEDKTHDVSCPNYPLEIQGLGGVRRIASGQRHMMFVTKSGSIYGLGENDVGQLGIGDQVSSVDPVLVHLRFPSLRGSIASIANTGPILLVAILVGSVLAAIFVVIACLRYHAQSSDDPMYSPRDASPREAMLSPRDGGRGPLLSPRSAGILLKVDERLNFRSTTPPQSV